jgi:hypothetical protein
MLGLIKIHHVTRMQKGGLQASFTGQQHRLHGDCTVGTENSICAYTACRATQHSGYILLKNILYAAGQTRETSDCTTLTHATAPVQLRNMFLSLPWLDVPLQATAFVILISPSCFDEMFL